MKRTFVYAAIGMLSSAIAFTACKKEDHATEVNDAVITVTHPYENQSYKKGDTVAIDAKIEASAKIHGYTMCFVNSKNDTVYKADDHVHSTSVNISKSWVNDRDTAGDLQLYIIATLDHDGNYKVKKTTFKAL